MMNLVAKTPSCVSSSTSVSLGKRYYGKQGPWKFVVADDGAGQLDRLSSTDYSREEVARQPREEVVRQPREEVARQQRGEVSRQANFFQPIPKPICDRSGQPDNKHEVFVDEGETSWSRDQGEICSRRTLLFISIRAT